MSNFTPKPWRLPDRYEAPHYEWSKPVTLIKSLERASADNRFSKAASLADLLAHRAETALNRVDEIHRDLQSGVITESEAMDKLETCRRWILSNV